LAYLGYRLGVEFLDARGEPAPTPEELLIRTLEDEGATFSEKQRQKLSSSLRTNVVAAHQGGDPTFDDLVARARLTAEALDTTTG
jgi:hypothetical protein